MALFCSPHTGFYGFVRPQLSSPCPMKPVSSFHYAEKQWGKRGPCAAVMIFPKENKNYVFLTMLAIASSRAASLIPIFLTPKTVLTGLEKCKRPDFLVSSTEHFEGEADRKAAPILLMLLICMTPEVPLYHLGHAVVRQVPTEGSALRCSFMTRKIDLTSPTIFKNTFSISFSDNKI